MNRKKTALQEKSHQHSNRQRTTRQLEPRSLALPRIAGEGYGGISPVDAGSAVCERVGSRWGRGGGVLNEKGHVSGGWSLLWLKKGQQKKENARLLGWRWIGGEWLL